MDTLLHCHNIEIIQNSSVIQKEKYVKSIDFYLLKWVNVMYSEPNINSKVPEIGSYVLHAKFHQDQFSLGETKFFIFPNCTEFIFHSVENS